MLVVEKHSSPNESFEDSLDTRLLVMFRAEEEQTISKKRCTKDSTV